MASFNKVVLIGRLTNDPEIRTTNNGLKIAQFTVAVDRPFGKNENGEKKTDFFRCKAWRQKADFVEQYIGKARLVCIEGRIELNDYTDKEGVKRYITEIDVANIETLDTRDRAGEATPSQGGGYGGGNRGGGGNSRYDDGGGDSNGYFADDEPAPARPVRSAPAQAAPARAPQRPAQASAPQPARRPAPTPAYDDDFDDSDPFADE
ncbi:single-stranded DNA-binding protein [bacterium]|nr:MAG: single-stranded DNA-binding protein [bacterium]